MSAQKENYSVKSNEESDPMCVGFNKQTGNVKSYSLKPARMLIEACIGLSRNI